MKTFKINADGGQFTGDHTLVMTRESGVPTPIGIIEAVGWGEGRTVKAYFLFDGFTPNDEVFPSKAAAERAITARYTEV